LSGTEKPTGLARKHILHISLVGGILWPIVEKEVVILGIGVEIAPIGQQATMMKSRPSRQAANSATNVKQNEPPVHVEAKLLAPYQARVLVIYIYKCPFFIYFSN
jgi:hypothetical protein